MEEVNHKENVPLLRGPTEEQIEIIEERQPRRILPPKELQTNPSSSSSPVRKQKKKTEIFFFQSQLSHIKI